jgi:hypothetical protein
MASGDPDLQPKTIYPPKTAGIKIASTELGRRHSDSKHRSGPHRQKQRSQEDGKVFPAAMFILQT